METEQEDERNEHGENDETEHRNHEPSPPSFRGDAVRRNRAQTTALHPSLFFFSSSFFSHTLCGDNIPLSFSVFVSFPLTLLLSLFSFFYFILIFVHFGIFVCSLFMSILDSSNTFFF